MVRLRSVATCLRCDNALCVSIKSIWHSILDEYWFRVADRESNHDFERSHWSLQSLLADSNGNVIQKILKRTEMSRVVSEKGTETAPRLLFSFQRVCWSMNFLEMPSSKSSVFDGSVHILPRLFENKSQWILGPFASFPTAKPSFKGVRASVKNSRFSCSIKSFRFSIRIKSRITKKIPLEIESKVVPNKVPVKASIVVSEALKLNRSTFWINKIISLWIVPRKQSNRLSCSELCIGERFYWQTKLKTFKTFFATAENLFSNKIFMKKLTNFANFKECSLITPIWLSHSLLRSLNELGHSIFLKRIWGKGTWAEKPQNIYEHLCKSTVQMTTCKLPSRP